MKQQKPSQLIQEPLSPKKEEQQLTEITVNIDYVEYFSYFIPPLILIFGMYVYSIYHTLFPMLWIFYGIVPLFDYLLPLDQRNRTSQEYEVLEKDRRYLIPLYFYGLVDFYFLYWALNTIYNQYYMTSWIELFIFTFTLATSAGMGTSAAHQLFHKKNSVHKIFGISLMFKMLNTNFFYSHTQGHHKKVATPADPASAPQGINVYEFGVKSIFYSFLDSWYIERDRLKKQNDNRLNKVEMLLYNGVFQLKVIEILGMGFIYYKWNMICLIFFIIHAYLLSFMLEAINYVEHYGLRRKQISPGNSLINNFDVGKYERTTIRHSWNAAHRITNALLFKIQRHSDHHENAYKSYQALCTYQECPQLPHGYSLTLMMAMFPFWWFRVMDPLVDAYQNTDRKPTKQQLQNADFLSKLGLLMVICILCILSVFYFI